MPVKKLNWCLLFLISSAANNFVAENKIIKSMFYFSLHMPVSLHDFMEWRTQDREPSSLFAQQVSPHSSWPPGQMLHNLTAPTSLQLTRKVSKTQDRHERKKGKKMKLNRPIRRKSSLSAHQTSNILKMKVNTIYLRKT